MKRYIVGIAAALLLAGPADAAAKVTYQPPPIWEGVAVVAKACPVKPYQGCVIDDVIYANGMDRQTLNHERGHAVSSRFLDPGERSKFMRLAHTAPWYEVKETGPDEAQVLTRASGEEQFADAYAHCVMGDTTAGHKLPSGGVRFSWWSSTPFQPSPQRLAQICNFITRAMEN